MSAISGNSPPNSHFIAELVFTGVSSSEYLPLTKTLTICFPFTPLDRSAPNRSPKFSGKGIFVMFELRGLV